MADVFTKAKRSLVMAAVRSHGNRDTELRLIAILRANGITGWRRRQPLPGKPDFVFWRERLAVFVDGCFWHGCRRHCRMPKSRPDFWPPKIARNRARDREVGRLLRRRGWRLLRIWEHSFQPGARKYPGHTGSGLDSPAKTLKAGDHGVPGGENMLAFADGSVRYFTVRESARLQTFPDSYIFPSSWTESMRQIGNAVPVALATAVGASIAGTLREHGKRLARSHSKRLKEHLDSIKGNKNLVRN